MRNKLKLLTLILVTQIPLSFAKEVFEANNGDTISANISSTNLTRIEIDGEKIIKDYSSADISKKITKPLGQVYLIPNTLQTFNIYVVSENGNTYNLKLTPSKKIHGDSILIKPIHNNRQSNVAAVNFSNQPYIRTLNYLIETMYLNKDDSQFMGTSLNQPIITYNGLDSVLLKSYTNGSMSGQVLLLKNVSKNKLQLTEAQFYSDHTLAVAIENPELAVNDFTRVFIVKEGQ